MPKTQNQPETFEFKAQMQELINIIIHSLYTHKEIFLRELISNASDALNKIRLDIVSGNKDVLFANLPLQIKIVLDEKNNFFSIEDTGIGMTRDDLINNIGTIASSGTKEFLKKIAKEGKNISSELIGQFGVGFYAVFMVADTVSIETRYGIGEAPAWRWTSSADGRFTIEEIDKKERGTKIYFHFKKEAEEFAKETRIKEIISKYSNFVSFPIFLNEKRVNTISALWYKNPQEVKENQLNEFYHFISNDFEDPLAHTYFSFEGAVNFKALLFLPSKITPFFLEMPQKWGLDLYSNKILIQKNSRNLLPDYLNFFKGVVDVLDLPLNISRETVQHTAVITKIRNILTNKILTFLKNLSTQERDKYKTFYRNFSSLLKSGIASDPQNKDKIFSLIYYSSTKREEGEVFLDDYLASMPAEQNFIYYISGESINVIKNNPNLEYFKDKDIEVLFFTDPADTFIANTAREYKGKIFKSIYDSDATGEVPKIERVDENLTLSLIALFKDILGEYVEDVVISRRLKNYPATLVKKQTDMDAQWIKIMKTMDRNFSYQQKRIMEINPHHPLIINLSRLYLADSKNPIIRKTILQLYEGLLFLEGSLEDPTDFWQRTIELLEVATEK